MLATIPELNDAGDDSVLSAWAKATPETAAAWIGARLEQGKEVPLGDKGALAELPIFQPEFTASWLTGLPEGKLQTIAAETLVANWDAFGPDAAAGWIASLPQVGLRSAAEKAMTRTHGTDRKPW